MYLADWKDEPVIGEVTKTSEKYFHIKYYTKETMYGNPGYFNRVRKTRFGNKNFLRAASFFRTLN